MAVYNMLIFSYILFNQLVKFRSLDMLIIKLVLMLNVLT